MKVTKEALRCAKLVGEPVTIRQSAIEEDRSGWIYRNLSAAQKAVLSTKESTVEAIQERHVYGGSPSRQYWCSIRVPDSGLLWVPVAHLNIGRLTI
jgi:hypothetical protein